MQNNFKQKAFAVKNKNLETRLQSSSGGVFSLCADYILNNSGAVYGADFDENMKLSHKRVTRKEEISRMRGAKYIRSSISGVYKQITEDLQNKTPILFCGTPCQVNAINKIAKNFPDNNLYTLDLFCHGVVQTKIWEKFIEFLENKYNKKIVFFKFRDKEKSWRKYSAKVYFSDGTTESHNNFTGSFLELFRYDVCIDNACTKCPFTNLDRKGDLSIGDFWGIEKTHPYLDDDKGVSAVIVNTKKGYELLEKIIPDCEIEECAVKDIAHHQPNLQRPSSFSNKAVAFNHDLENLPFEKVLKKYTRVGLKRRMIDIVKSVR